MRVVPNRVLLAGLSVVFWLMLAAAVPCLGAESQPPANQPQEQQKPSLWMRLTGPAKLARLRGQVAEFTEQGRYDAALPLAEQAVGLCEQLYGKNHPDYAVALSWMARVLSGMGDYAKAEPLYREALELTKKSLGEQHPDYATSLNNLAALYHDMGDYAKAEPLYREALELTKKSLGEQHPDYATSLNNLAALYHDMGEYAKAEPLFREALELTKKSLGEQHPAYATSLNNLAQCYCKMSEYSKAEPLYREALELRKKSLGEQHPAYATSLNNLAGLYHDLGEYGKAERLYRQVLEIRKKSLGEQHPDYAASLNNLAQCYCEMSEYSKAEPLYLQAMQIFKKALGAEHPAYATSLDNLAALYHDLGEYGKAERLYRQALEIDRKAFGEHHPLYGTTLNNLAALYHELGEYAKAEPLYRQALEQQVAYLRRTVGWVAESRAMALRGQLVRPGPLLSTMRKLDRDALAAYEALWRSEAVVTRALSQRRRSAADMPEAQPLFERLLGVQQQLAQLLLSPPQQASPQTVAGRIDELERQKEELEEQLARLSLAFRRELEAEQAGPTELANALRPGSVLVELAAVPLLEKDPKTNRLEAEAHYEAFVLRRCASGPRPEAAWVHLGPIKPIEEAAAAWRRLIARGEGLAAGADHPATLLRGMVWDKLEPHLGGATDVYLVCRGPLAFVPWSALPGSQPGTCLVEQYNIMLAAHGQELYRGLTEPASVRGGLLAVGDVDYDRRPGRAVGDLLAGRPAGPVSRAAAPTAERAWRPLPGTVEEIRAIAEFWGRRGPYVELRGERAGETAVRMRLPGNRYVHLATHGFFADPKYGSIFDFGRTDGSWATAIDLFMSPRELRQRRQQAVLRNPLVLSGVVLAGANLGPQSDGLGLPTGEDGILTAEEIAFSDLRGTELVVLSACDTGLGKVAGGEGVMGLVRAFHLAGARNVVASLWKVDDQATAAMMRVFYHKLWQENKPPAVALRETQLLFYRGGIPIDQIATLRGPDFQKLVQTPKRPGPAPAPADIRRWAAFVLSGPGR